MDVNAHGKPVFFLLSSSISVSTNRSFVVLRVDISGTTINLGDHAVVVRTQSAQF